MNRRDILKGAAGGAVTAMLNPGSTAAPSIHTSRRPNVVFMCADDMDFNEIGCYGGDRVLTPNIDRLAAEGVRFDNCYVTSSVCTPSRYSALTGRFASRSKSFLDKNRNNPTPCIGWDTFLERDTPTIQSELRRSGYVTGFVGKWHLSTTSEDWKKVKGRSALDPDTLRIMQEDYARNVNEIREHGFSHVDGVYAQNLRAIAIPKKFECMNLDWKTACALRFIEENRDNPFFLYLATNAPHTTVVKDSNYLVNEFKKDTRYTPNGMLPEKPDVLKDRDQLLDRIEKKGLPKGTVIASWIDASVGAVIDKLEALGIRDNTVIVFTSDHQSVGKFTCYEGSRSPCIVSGRPAITRPGNSSAALVSNIDLAPTIFEICGVDAGHEVDGVSFLPVLRGAAKQTRESLLLETACCRAVVTQDRWKYIALRLSPEETAKAKSGETCYTNGTGMVGYWRNNPETVAAYPNMGQFDQLFNLTDDPRESKNLFADAKHSDRARNMQNMLREHLGKLPLAFGEFTRKQ